MNRVDRIKELPPVSSSEKPNINEVLDKIRAEIMNLTNGDTPERIWNVDVLAIIDKYKAEGSGEE